VFVVGTTPADLQEGPGLMLHTAVPGDPGNAVIAGRRTTYGAPFASLDTMRRGDHIDIVDGAGRFTFTVTELRHLTGGHDDVVGVRGQRWLTLVTSSSSLVSSGYDVVVAKATSADQTPGRIPQGTYSTTLTSLSGDPAAAVLAGAWVVVFLLGLGVTVFAIRRWRRMWQTYVLAFPVLLTCGLFACESLARCLPATL
jgi:sortase A